jgi:hypothetical protein
MIFVPLFVAQVRTHHSPLDGKMALMNCGVLPLQIIFKTSLRWPLNKTTAVQVDPWGKWPGRLVDVRGSKTLQATNYKFINPSDIQ